MMSSIIMPAVRQTGKGRDCLTLEIPAIYRQAVQILSDRAESNGGYIQVRLALPQRPRTTGWRSQNHHINGHIQQITMETGNSFSAVKERMKELSLDRGYPFETLPDRSIKPRSEADIDVVQAGYLIDTIHQFAAEWGILLIEETIDDRE